MVSLLLDANLSWRSVEVLNNHFDNCYHVDNIGFIVPAKDSEIWSYAKNNKLVIITNDEDFLNLQVLWGFPPKVVLLRTGNLKRKEIEDILINSKKDIVNLLESDEFGLLEIIK